MLKHQNKQNTSENNKVKGLTYANLGGPNIQYLALIRLEHNCAAELTTRHQIHLGVVL
jgi:hypothetical protein